MTFATGSTRPVSLQHGLSLGQTVQLRRCSGIGIGRLRIRNPRVYVYFGVHSWLCVGRLGRCRQAATASPSAQPHPPRRRRLNAPTNRVQKRRKHEHDEPKKQRNPQEQSTHLGRVGVCLRGQRVEAALPAQPHPPAGRPDHQAKGVIVCRPVVLGILLGYKPGGMYCLFVRVLRVWTRFCYWGVGPGFWRLDWLSLGV